MDKFNPKYDDFVVEPTYSLSIKDYIPLLLRSITKRIQQRVAIPSVIIELIISYYPLDSTYKIYQFNGRWCAELSEISQLCTLHPSRIWYSLKWHKHYFQTHENELFQVSGLTRGDYRKSGLNNLTQQSDKNLNISIVSNGICAGHTFIVEKDGTIYGFGNNDKYKLGNDSDKNALFYHRPTLRSSLTKFFAKMKIIKVECGSSWSLFLCNNGKVYSFGYNLNGECGVKFKYPTIPTPRVVLKNMIDICCGSTFSLCLDRKHKVWCFGDNSAGYLCLGHNDKISQPVLHPFFKETEIEYIRCGQRHAMIIGFDGDCYLCGSDSNGQCGYSASEYGKLCPNPNLYNKKVKNGWCGSNHSVVYTMDNELIAFGAVKYEWNRSKHEMNGFGPNQYIVRVIPGHNATFLIVHNNNGDFS